MKHNNSLSRSRFAARLNSGAMSIKRKIRQHLSDVDNVITYLLFATLFLYELFDGGWKSATRAVAALAFLGAGWFVVAYVAGSIRARNLSMTVGVVVSLLYFSGFCVYWIAEFGFNRKAIILSLPIFTGLVLVAAYWILETDTYEKLRKLEKRFYQKMFSVFRKKK